MDIEKFSECCLAKVCRDNDNHVRLVVCCVLRDPTSGEKVVHRKEVNLDQLIQYAHKMFANYHHKVHQSQPEVSGSWDDMLAKSVDVAKRIGEARLIRSLFAEVSPILSNNAAGVDGGESDMHKKAHELLVKAREGDRDALDTMNSLMNAAYRGNSRALEIMVLMRDMNLALDGKEAVKISGINCAGMTTPELVEVGSWWSKFKKVAKVATAPVWAPAYLATKAVSKLPGGKYLNKVSPAAWASKAIKGGAQAPRAPRAPRVISRQPRQPNPQSQPQMQDQGFAPQEQGYPQNQGYDPGYENYDPSYEDQTSYEDPGYPGYEEEAPEFAGPQAEVSGWLYNKGYRTVAETVTSKFPGLGLTMREMYHRGYDSDKALALAPIEAEHTGASQETPIVTASGTYIVGLSWASLMDKAKSIAKTVKNTTKTVANNSVFKAVSPYLSKVAPMVASVVPGGGMAYAAAQQAHNMLVQAKKANPEAVKAIAVIRNAALEGDKKALAVASVMKNMSDKLDEKAAAQPPVTVTAVAPTHTPMVQTPAYVQRLAPAHASRGFFPAPIALANNSGSFYHRGLGHRWMGKHLRHVFRSQPQVAGWAYNKPYRGVIEAPGAGLVLREMYNRGEGREPTTFADVLREVFPLGIGT
jgi:hypothetical protein